jgi:hypothetical protein
MSNTEHASTRIKALYKVKRSCGSPQNKHEASSWNINIYAAFINITTASPLQYAYFIITVALYWL